MTESEHNKLEMKNKTSKLRHILLYLFIFQINITIYLKIIFLRNTSMNYLMLSFDNIKLVTYCSKKVYIYIYIYNLLLHDV